MWDQGLHISELPALKSCAGGGVGVEEWLEKGRKGMEKEDLQTRGKGRVIV